MLLICLSLYLFFMKVLNCQVKLNFYLVSSLSSRTGRGAFVVELTQSVHFAFPWVKKRGAHHGLFLSSWSLRSHTHAESNCLCLWCHILPLCSSGRGSADALRWDRQGTPEGPGPVPRQRKAGQTGAVARRQGARWDRHREAELFSYLCCSPVPEDSC